jgi:hypothetical protein
VIARHWVWRPVRTEGSATIADVLEGTALLTFQRSQSSCQVLAARVSTGIDQATQPARFLHVTAGGDPVQGDQIDASWGLVTSSPGLSTAERE